MLLLLATNCIPAVINHLLAMVVEDTDHHCKVPSSGPPSLFIPQATNSSLDSCKMYLNPTSPSQGYRPCVEGHTWLFSSHDKWSIVAEWSLVCEKEFLTSMMRNIYLGGMMLGGIFFGVLSDGFGRRWAMLACLYSQSLIGIGLYFVEEFWVFVGLRCAQGVFIQGLFSVTYSLAVELVGPCWRSSALFVIRAFWCLGFMMFIVVTRYVEHWRFVQLVVNIPTMATLLYIWFIPESTRWLLLKGNVKHAEKITASIISYNSLKVDPTSIKAEMETVSKEIVFNGDSRRSTNLFQASRISVRLVVVSFAFFSVSMCSYGMSYHVPVLLGNRYLDMFMLAGIELGALLLAYVMIWSFGGHTPLCLFLSLCGIISISIVLVSECLADNSVNIDSVVIGLSLLGQASVASSYITLLLYTCQIFPTVIRTSAIGSCTVSTGAGSLLAPYAFTLVQYLVQDGSSLVSFVTLGVLCLIAAVLIFLLPDKSDTNLPDTIKEAITVSGLARHKSADSLDAGYGKCPEFVCVDGLIVSKYNAVTLSEGADESGMGTLRSKISSYLESDMLSSESEDQQGWNYEQISLNSNTSIHKQINISNDTQEMNYEELPSSMENLSSSSKEHLLSSKNSLIPEEQDCSVVSAESSMVYESDANDEAIIKMMRRKLLVMEGEETRL